jgi:uncharacterized protein YjbI with pentapeptide repeats
MAIACGGWLAAETIVRAENPEHVQRLLKSNQCPLCDLSGANLADANLYGANLVGANLTGATLSRSNLGAANLSDADLTNANLSQSYLQSAQLENTTLTGADLSRAYLRDVSLSNVTLTGANLQGANLSRTNLSGLDLRGVDLTGANLSNSALSGISTSGSSSNNAFAALALSIQGNYLCEAPLDDAAIASAKQSGLNLAFADLSGAILKDANLSGALMPKVNLTGANLSGANLSGACLRNSNLKNAVLDGADLANARMEGAVLENASTRGIKNAKLEATVPSELAAAQQPIQAAARQAVASMNRAQQAYYLEKEQFATTLNGLGVGISPETEHYLYRIFVYPDRKRGVMVAGVPKRSGFKTYVGLVNIAQIPNSKDISTFAVLCESEQAKPLLPKLPTTFPQSGGFSCPAGFSDRN